MRLLELEAIPSAMSWQMGTQRYYWVRAIDVDGRESIRNPDSDTSTIQATSGQLNTSQLNDDANFADTANLAR